jgi:hypothetical protein
MTKNTFAIYFGLVVLALSLFASTAFASTATSINVKDVDAAARKPYQTGILSIDVPDDGITYHALVTVPDNQRLVIEQVSGFCNNLGGPGASYVALNSDAPGDPHKEFEFLGKEFVTDNIPASASLHFYANPGETFGLAISPLFHSGGGYCDLTVSGYFVNLP